MKARYKILIIAESIDVDDSSGSKANVALIQNLKTIGYNLTVYHYTRKEIQLKEIPCFSIIEKKGFLYLLSRFQRIIQRTFKINLSKSLENIFGFSFTFFNDVNSIKSFINTKVDGCDLVLTLSKGASFRPHYAVLKLPKLHNKWMAYVHDPYPFHCYPKPYDWFESGYKQKEVFFRKVSIKARHSGFPSQLLKDWMGNYFPNFLKTGVIIPHQNFDLKCENIMDASYFDKSKFNLLHAGNLMKQRSPKGLIEGFQLFLSSNPNTKKDARLLLLGNASYHKEMLLSYNKQLPELYISRGNVSFNEVYSLQQNTSVNIILESKAEISPFLPGKFPHCVMANKPILLLAPENSETKRLLGDNYEYHTEVDKVTDIAKMIQQLYELWLKSPDDLKLDRKDLEHYVSHSHLEEIINSLN